MRLTLLVLAFSISTAIGCSSNSPAPPGTFPEGIDLSITQGGAASTQFDFAQLRELWVRVRVAQLSGTTVLKLSVTSPAGEPMYESQVAYSADPSVQTMNATGAPHPVSVFPAQAMGSGYVLEYLVPIAGSALSRFPARGRWQVSAAFSGGKVLSATMDVTYGP
jgi:hypothetical protein